MVEIISRGRLPEEDLLRKTCQTCHTVFSFTIAEGTESYDQREGHTVTINCPVCFKMCYFTL